MKYVAIDIETTGLDPEKDQILEIAAIADDTSKEVPISQLSRFRAVVCWEEIHGNPYALQMNSELLREICEGQKNLAACRQGCIDHFHKPEWAKLEFSRWLGEYFGESKPTAAGKNFGSFDRQFLKRYCPAIHFHHRSLEPAMWYIENSDVQPPDLSTCLARAGLPGIVLHRAMQDAEAVVKLVRHAFAHKLP